MRWWRIIIDEGHSLRSNGKTVTRINEFKAVQKWVMTGTPISNLISNLEGLVRVGNDSFTVCSWLLQHSHYT